MNELPFSYLPEPPAPPTSVRHACDECGRPIPWPAPWPNKDGRVVCRDCREHRAGHEDPPLPGGRH